MNESAELQNKKFHEKYDNKELTIDELAPLFSEPGYICAGHGTGRSGNGDEVVNLIFDNGLRTKDNSLCFTSIFLNTPTPELIEQNQKLGISPPTIDTLKNDLNNWQHMDSKKIIIARLPSEYINWHGDRDDHDGEMFGAFMNEVVQENGKINYYLDSRFILGCYNVYTKTFRVNSKYERILSNSTKEKLKEGYLKALKKTEDRHKRTSAMFRLANNRVAPTNDIVQSQEYNFDIADFEYTDEDQNFSQNDKSK